MNDTSEVIMGIIFIVGLLAAWLTHIIVSIQTASWFILLAGAILFPIGIIHGIGIWFGAF